ITVVGPSLVELSKVNLGKIDQLHKRRFFGSGNVVALVFFAAVDGVFEPRWRPFRSVLLEEGSMIYAIRPADEREGTPFDVTENCRSDLEVIFDQLRFNDPVRREKSLSEI